MIVDSPGGDDDYGAVAYWIQGANNEVSYNVGMNNRGHSYDYGTDGGFLELYDRGDNSFIHHNWAENNNGFFELETGADGRVPGTCASPTT